MPANPHKAPQVAVLLPSSVKVCRDMRRGILRYVHRHGPWGLHILEGRDGEQKLTRMKEWGCTGVIIRPGSPELDNIVLKTGVPTVLIEDPKGFYISKFNKRKNYSVVQSDTEAIGRLAAGYFMERKFENYAFVGEIHGLAWSVKRGQAFAKHLAESGFKCHISLAIIG